MQQRVLSDDFLKDLAASLPCSGEAAIGDDLDRRARATLSYLVDAMIAADMHAAVVPLNPETCPNCGDPMTSKTSPYCSSCCREQAAFVRQMRDGLATGSILDLERQVSKGEVLWRLLGGGLPRRLSMVPEKAREKVFKRDEWTCQECGAPATTIDNTGSG